MTERVAEAKKQLIAIIEQNGGSLNPDALFTAMHADFTRREIHSAIQTALGQDEIRLDGALRFETINVLQAA